MINCLRLTHRMPQNDHVQKSLLFFSTARFCTTWLKVSIFLQRLICFIVYTFPWHARFGWRLLLFVRTGIESTVHCTRTWDELSRSMTRRRVLSGAVVEVRRLSYRRLAPPNRLPPTSPPSSLIPWSRPPKVLFPIWRITNAMS